MAGALYSLVSGQVINNGDYGSALCQEVCEYVAKVLVFKKFTGLIL